MSDFFDPDIAELKRKMDAGFNFNKVATELLEKERRKRESLSDAERRAIDAARKAKARKLTKGLQSG